MKTFDFDTLNKKALAKITVLNHVVRNHKSNLKRKSGFILPLCKENSGDISASDFEELFGTFADWYFNQIGENICYTLSEYEVGNISTEVTDKVKYATYRIYLSDVQNVFERVDTPKKWLKRSNSPKTENTSDENAPTSESSETSDENAPTSESSETSGDEHYTDNIREAVDKFNEQVEADNLEILNNTINSYADMIGKLFGDSSNKKALQEMLFNFATTILS